MKYSRNWGGWPCGATLVLLLCCACLSGCAGTGATVKTYSADTTQDGNADTDLTPEQVAAAIETAKAKLEAEGKDITDKNLAAIIDFNNDGVADSLIVTEQASGVLESIVSTATGWLPSPFNNGGTLAMTLFNLGLLYFRRKDKQALLGTAEEIQIHGNKDLMASLKLRALPALNKIVTKMNNKQMGKPTNIVSSIATVALDTVASIFATGGNLASGRKGGRKK